MAAGVGQQVPKRDRTRGRAKLRRAVGIKASEHLRPFELRQHLADWRIKAQPSLLHKLSAQALVTALVIDAIQKTLPGSMRSPAALRVPVAPM